MQSNALRSWSLLKPKPEVLVMGHEDGVAEICEELGYRHITDVQYSDAGTPMLNSMFELADELASNPHVCLVSADVVLFQCLMLGLEAIKEELNEFCAVCRKQTQKYVIPLDFDEGWEEVVRMRLQWNMITSGDLYMYTRGYWGKIPPFVIGRCKCDSWLFYEASRKGNLVDMTEAVTIVDYKHGYGFRTGEWKEDWQKNRDLAGEHQADIRASNYKLTSQLKVQKIAKSR